MTNSGRLNKSELNSGNAANKLEKFAALIGITQCKVTWLDDSQLYRIIAMDSTDFMPSEDSAIRHMIQVARVWRKTSDN